MYIMLILITGISLIGCDPDNSPLGQPGTPPTPNPPSVPYPDPPATGNQINIKVGTTTFTATIEDNPTSAAFKSMLPLNIFMRELNNNEKYVDLQGNLPTNSYHPRTIQKGDIMLYGSNTLVLFYKTFTSPYSYTRIGRIDNVSGLEAALGTGNINVTFNIQ